MRALLFYLLVIWGGSAFGQAGDDDTPGRLASFRNELENILEASGTPGLGIALVMQDRVVWTAGLGLADRESSDPVTADTVFRIGSISKSFVALAAMMLV